MRRQREELFNCLADVGLDNDENRQLIANRVKTINRARDTNFIVKILHQGGMRNRIDLLNQTNLELTISCLDHSTEIRQSIEYLLAKCIDHVFTNPNFRLLARHPTNAPDIAKIIYYLNYLGQLNDANRQLISEHVARAKSIVPALQMMHVRDVTFDQDSFQAICADLHGAIPYACNNGGKVWASYEAQDYLRIRCVSRLFALARRDVTNSQPEVTTLGCLPGTILARIASLCQKHHSLTDPKPNKVAEEAYLFIGEQSFSA